MAMSRPECARIEELLPAFALDALDAVERAEVQEHLTTCELHAESEAFGAVAIRLAELAPEMEPSAGLRDRIRAIPRMDTGAGAGMGADHGDESHAVQPIALGARRSRTWVPYTMAAVFAAVAVFMGAWNVMLQNERDGSNLLVAESTTNGILAQVAYVPSQGVTVVQIRGLSELPAGRDYQLWAIPPDGAPLPVGLMQPVEGAATHSVPGEVGTGWTFAVTVEPEGGSEAPTTTPISAVTF